MKNFLIKNWKTSTGGVIIAIAIFLKAKSIIDADTLVLISSTLGSIGLIAAKDADKSGVE